MIGRVYQVISGFYDIKCEDKFYRVRAIGNLRNLKLNPVVGDLVVFDESLTKIEPRKNILIRPKVANIDQAIIVISLDQPKFSSFLLDKFLSIIEFQKIKVVIIFTKADLNTKEDIGYYLKTYQSYLTSLDDENSYKKLNDIFEKKISVLVGQSGVGKTTILNKVSSNNFFTQNISKALGRGKHSTRVVKMIDFNNGQIIDTPGFSSIEIQMSQKDLSKSFESFDKYSQRCKYRHCLHQNERLEDCNIKQLVQSQEIPLFRYNNYLKLLDEVK
ncbi:ribosome small subunit-dependent GTPase A [Mycoplasmopsis pulmonis]|uniref:ribosome small subunit-dependent GTPase A n=1 Tax=Mycoplasmopsis pulmonis TaxID=2107 RepID=UPI001004F47B|nr:ribosome small subunit-dependent GTPase A [Mycoplasmopsis pulmonis]MDZ7293463.1 ribosome small subunit-dependent GTPase A [Mycoplasmopsis pulmonis]VEU68451.1 putative GTPase engC [Mycoplasmopsis pulmonis]